MAKFNDSYGGDFDLEGFSIYKTEEWEAYINFLRKLFNEFSEVALTYYFGSNCSFEWDSCEEYTRQITLVPISLDQYKSLDELFNPANRRRFSYGQFISPSDVVDRFMDELSSTDGKKVITEFQELRDTWS